MIFFKGTYNAGTEITHVGIFAGNGMMIHAGTQKVEIVPLNGYWKEHFKGVGSFKYLNAKYNKEIAQKNFNLLTNHPNSKGLPDKKSDPLPEIKPEIKNPQPQIKPLSS